MGAAEPAEILRELFLVALYFSVSVAAAFLGAWILCKWAGAKRRKG